MSRPFDIGAAVQAGVTFLLTNIVSIATRNIGLLTLFGLAVVILTIWMEDAILSVLFGLIIGSVSTLSVIWSIIILLLALVVRVVVIGILIARFHALAANVPPQGWAFRFGEEANPLIGIRKDEAIVGRTFAFRAWYLWPFLIAFLSFFLSDIYAFLAEVDAFNPDRASEHETNSWVYYILGWIFTFWGLTAVIRRFFYLVPVVHDTGTADARKARSFVTGIFPFVLVKPLYWQHIALIVLCWLPFLGMSWLGGMAVDATGEQVQDSNLLVVFIASVFEFLALVVSTAIFAGALARLYPGMRESLEDKSAPAA